MKNRKTRRPKTPRLRAFRGGREATATTGPCAIRREGIVCLYGVPVQHTLADGLELVEFEFLPDAA